ncbi:unnamed protein product [Caretta caretta]
MSISGIQRRDGEMCVAYGGQMVMLQAGSHHQAEPGHRAALQQWLHQVHGPAAHCAPQLLRDGQARGLLATEQPAPVPAPDLTLSCSQSSLLTTETKTSPQLEPQPRAQLAWQPLSLMWRA